jgi:hypothetical protein
MDLPQTILVVSFNPERMNACHRLFKDKNYFFVSASTRASAEALIREGTFDLMMVGTSIPTADREAISSNFRHSQPQAAIVWMLTEPLPPGPLFDAHVVSGDDEGLVKTVAHLAPGRKKQPRPMGGSGAGLPRRSKP